jgi:hypothetical protein
VQTNCEPYTGELNENWLPITDTGELFMPGTRACNNKDCVNPEHVNTTFALCATDQCEAKPYSEGLCNKHFYALRKETGRPINKQDVLEQIINSWSNQTTAETCSYEDCKKPFKARGVCFTHYMSWYQYHTRLNKQQPPRLQ